MTNCHINICIDNTTAVSYINAMGGALSLEWNKIAREIWTWCIQRNIWVTAISLPGKENVELIGNVEHLMITQNGLSRIIFSTALLRPMACHPLIFLHLELTGTFPVICYFFFVHFFFIDNTKLHLQIKVLYKKEKSTTAISIY